MGPRIGEGWGGNRVYNGGAWMELYWFLDTELSGDPAWSLTSNGKIPNSYESVWARFKVNAVFDANTFDNSNTFKMSPGSSFPNFNGSVNIPSVREREIYNDRVLIYPMFGEVYNVRAICSLSGINRVPGTTSFDRWVSIPARAWAKPEAPTSDGATINHTTNRLTFYIYGNQNTPSQDRYWQNTDWTIWRSATGAWTEVLGQAGSRTSYTWDVSPNSMYRVGARAWNPDAGVSEWSSWVTRYSKPAAPSSLSASRHPTTRTTVQLSWTNNAPYADGYRVYRWSGSSWVYLGYTSSTTFNDTDQPLASRPQYRVEARTPDNTYSDVSPPSTAPYGYTVPSAPTNVVLDRTSATSARLTFSGQQTNPAAEKYWAGMEFSTLANTGSWVAAGTSPTGDITFFDLTTVLAPNSRYMARARATNSAGSGPWANSGYVYTEPSAPTAVTAARVAETSEVTVSWSSPANYVGAHRVLRSTDGGPFVEVGTSTSLSFTDTLNTASFASYAVVTDTPAPVASSAQSASSGTVPTVSFVKENIPGIDKIFVGTTKVFRVMAGDQQIWLG